MEIVEIWQNLEKNATQIMIFPHYMGAENNNDVFRVSTPFQRVMTSSSEKPVTVGYWAIRCYVEPIILVLEYKQVPYNFVGYIKEQQSDGSWFGGKWFKVCFTTNDFSNASETFFLHFS